MYTRTMIAIVLVALAAGGVVAQPVTNDQTICFFFDEEATIRSFFGEGVIVGYIVVNPLWVGGARAEVLQRWTCTFYWQAAPGVVGNCDVWPRMGWPVELDVTSGSVDVDVTCDIPLTPIGPIVVAMVGFYLASAEPVAIFVSPGEFWADGGQHGVFIYMTSGPHGPMDMTEHAANINAPAPIDSGRRTWGDVKMMYR